MTTRNRTLTVLTAAAVAMTTLALTTVTANAATIYSDDFDGGASSILGLAPDVAPGGEVWVGYGTGFYANGDRVGHPHTAYLPFTPAAGNVYTLSADVYATGGWTYFGFCSSDPDGLAVRHDTLGSYGSFLYYSTTSAGQNLMTFYGENMNGNLTHSGVCVAGVNNLKAVLDATDADSANWTMELFLNGTSIRAAATAPVGNYGNIGYAGFNNTAGGGVGTVHSFLLEDNTAVTDEVPEPATMALLSLAACGLGGYVRRRRKA
ncbi:MAG: hypothetical protein AMK72_08315 [Planctomycetes bacterium SM23_25]|nr:MAG: hypothetical protein AMK72_08315 [Planctomycetes bacterium SM23_25]